MELLVVGRDVRRLRLREHQLQQLLKAGQLFLGKRERRALCGDAGQRSVDCEVIEEVLGLERRHERATSWNVVDQAFAFEGNQGLTHWQLADAEQLGDLVLRDPRARLELADEDLSAQVLDDIELQIASDGPVGLLHGASGVQDGQASSLRENIVTDPLPMFRGLECRQWICASCGLGLGGAVPDICDTVSDMAGSRREGTAGFSRLRLTEGPDTGGGPARPT